MSFHPASKRAKPPVDAHTATHVMNTTTSSLSTRPDLGAPSVR